MPKTAYCLGRRIDRVQREVGELLADEEPRQRVGDVTVNVVGICASQLLRSAFSGRARRDRPDAFQIVRQR
jgi:hypothetical protein